MIDGVEALGFREGRSVGKRDQILSSKKETGRKVRVGKYLDKFASGSPDVVIVTRMKMVVTHV